jgi:hypothetical protein
MAWADPEKRRAYNARPDVKLKKSLDGKRRYASLTPEERDRIRSRARERWAAAPEEKKEGKRAKERERKRRVWASMTPEQKAEVNRRAVESGYSRRYQRLKSGIKDAPAERREGPCEICGRVGALCLDHDHATGEIRGWLCPSCNRGLGLFRDSSDLMRKAFEYLERPSWKS